MSEAKSQQPVVAGEAAPAAEESPARSGTRMRRVITAGSRIGGYVIEAKLGSGGMAEVYAAHRQGPHGFRKPVAIKRILPAASEDSAFVSMFIDEAALAARLSHPNIVQVFDFGEDDGELFIAMELVEGTSLGRLLRSIVAHGEVMPLPVALYCVGQAARALDHAHRLRSDDGESLQVVHRDVSPGNLLVTRAGHVKLADFGIACTVVRPRHTGEHDLRGKLGYMSPEQVQGKPLDGKSDVFTLSVILAELLMGGPLFAGGGQLEVLLRIRDVDLRALSQSRRRIPSDIRGLLADGLCADPAVRPDARAFAERVEAIGARRGFAADASRQLCNLLSRFELCAVYADDVGTVDVAPPTSVFPAALDATAPRIEVQTAPNATLLRERAYRVPLRSGRELDGVQFPELLRLATTGEIDAGTLVRKIGRDPRPARELPELARVFATPALQWDPQELARPRIRGDVCGAALLPVIHSLAHKRETGVLHIRDGARRKKIYFVDGRPDFVASTSRGELLGNHLVDSGVCLPMELDMALAVLPQHRGRLGDALVGLRVLRPVELYRAVSAQVRARYLEAFSWRRGEFVYVRGKQSDEETYPLEQDAYVLMREACESLHPSEIEATLAPLWEKVLRPPASPRAALRAYQAPDSWGWVIAQARGDQTIGSLMARAALQSGIDAEEAMRAIFLALSCGLLEAA